MGIKRWIFLAVLGLSMVIAGSAVHVSEVFIGGKVFDLITVFFGIILIIIGFYKILSSLVKALIPKGNKDIVDILYQKRHLERGPRIVVVGGGTGLSVLLHGIKEYTSNIAAIVTVADSGGSSGRLREQFDILPPGDIRNCLVALADSEPLMQKLFQFRFEKGGELSGHNFGNLFITAMTKVTGDFEEAVKESSKVLAIRGTVIPSTLDNVALVAQYEDGSTIEGEDRIPTNNKRINKISLSPSGASATKEALKAINEAEVIILGPGSLYTSIIPNLLIKGITEAIANSKALKIYICNVMTQPGETDTYRASDHIDTIARHSTKNIVDYCVINVAKDVPKELLEKYQQQQSFPVIADSQRIKELGYNVVGGDLISTLDFVRHDSEKLAKIIIGLILSKKPSKK